MEGQLSHTKIKVTGILFAVESKDLSIASRIFALRLWSFLHTEWPKKEEQKKSNNPFPMEEILEIFQMHFHTDPDCGRENMRWS